MRTRKRYRPPSGAIEDKSSDAIVRRRQLVQRRFAWDGIAKQYSDFLKELCENNRAGACRPGPRQEDTGVVVIGRNEGERLVRCLQSVSEQTAAFVYVDSASDDDSVAKARKIGADVANLDPSIPFTAARARNAGVERLKVIAPHVKYVQFVDGDCEVRHSWLGRGRQELEADATLAAVCGRRRERFPRRSIYNRLMDLEWDTPIGPARSVGGDAMFRLDAFNAVGGFDASVMAGEEPQLCLRLRHANWKLLRVDAEMTLHDAAMARFGQWWRRQVRGGYGALDVYQRFPVGGERLFAKPTRSAVLWAAGWPAAVVAAGLIGLAIRGPSVGLTAGMIVFFALPLQMARLSARELVRGMRPQAAVAYGVLTMLAKWAWFAGQVRYRRDRAQGGRLQLIEYKRSSPWKASPRQPAGADR